jgi:hypothetical protein
MDVSNNLVEGYDNYLYVKEMTTNICNNIDKEIFISFTTFQYMF